MSRIAKSACTQCHYIFPRNEMVQVDQTNFSGFSVGQRQNSGRAYFRNRKVWLCNECYQKRVDIRNTWIGIIVLFGLGIWGWSYLFG